jgi:hypothetical protein
MNKVKKKTANLPPKLTETEQDLLSHIQAEYELETDSLGGNPTKDEGRNNSRVKTPKSWQVRAVEVATLEKWQR